MPTILTSVVQIITESLPISSSGHVQLLQQLMHIVPESTYQHTLIDYALHLPTVCSIALFFRAEYLSLLIGIKKTWPYVLRIILYGIAAELMTVSWYLLIKHTHLHIPLWIGFASTSVSLLSLYWCKPSLYSSMNIYKALAVGFIQGIALLSGFSRFALTYSVCCWMGLKPTRAIEWSMLIQWPLIFAASVVAVYVLYAEHIVQLLHLPWWLSMLGASIFAYALLCGMYYMVRYQVVWLWGIYMIIPTFIAWYNKL